MATNYYVSTGRGNDSTGTGTATNPWATINKAVGSSPAITPASGDVLYLEPGVYRASNMTLGLAPTSEFKIVGDCDGAGFLAGGYSTPVLGLVDWSAYTTNDTTSPASTSLISTASGKNFITFQKIRFLSGLASPGVATVTGGHDWKFQDCHFIGNSSGNSSMIAFTATVDIAANWTIERCAFWFARVAASSHVINITAPMSALSEYDLNFVVRNCMFASGSNGINLGKSGTSTFLASGVKVQTTDFFFSSTALQIYSGVATTMVIPALTCYNSVIWGATAGISAGATSQVVEDYNYILAVTTRTNVTNTGGHDNTVNAVPFGLNQEILTGLPARLFFTPPPSSWTFGSGAGGTAPTDDFSGRIRPEGGLSIVSAIGAMERHDTMAKDTTYPDGGSGACGKLVGPSSQERPILVNATATVISIKVRWDGNHADSAKPQCILLANPEIGVAGQTLTASSSGGSGSTPNSYETLTFSSITPTAAGVVYIKMVSRAAAGNGVAYFDTISLA